MSHSLRRRLLWLILGLVTVVWLIASWRVYDDARHEVDEVYDASLAQSARVLLGLLAHELEEEQESRENARRVLAEVGPEALAAFPLLGAILGEYSGDAHEHIEWLERGDQPGHRYESKLALLAKYPDGELLLRSPNAPDPGDDVEGFVDHADGDRRWRVFSIVDPPTGLRVMVGERVEVRRELVRYITMNAVIPLAVALPILALLIWLAVGRGLRPLAMIAAQVERRAPEALEPIPVDCAPREARPLLDSLNDLFTRLDRALQQERRFTADAAHELRTPLAALRAQAQVAMREADPERRQQALVKIQLGVDRATHLVSQLLTLARADVGGGNPGPGQRIELAALLGELLAEMADDALAQGAELGFDDGGGVIDGDPGALRILVRNLIDNAIRYGGDGVDVRVSTRREGDAVVLTVDDDGPGIPDGDRARVMQRFHRRAVDVSGSGLGLSIVQRIAEVHGAELVLDDGPGGRGLAVRVRFPAPR